ncbi:L-asparaginase [Leucosporidium creatinivorum]|uniref:asparaginase n=1 Tax=Leucosporidium creatinivorum TaxID=106004 RepID=A0A1Y2EQG5_9BASI|nr:L-asparaginase [Leucosporidium creatinivorum]
MKFTSTLVAAAGLLASPALAAPYAQLQTRNTTSSSSTVEQPVLNVTYTSPVNSSLPNVVIFATGGTIAGSSASNTDTTKYTAGVVGIEALVQAVPNILNVTNVVGSQVANTGSVNINSTIILRMAKLANGILCAENSTTDGLVITHGTDTLEETAFFMDMTVNCKSPVVVVGAMRPSTAISADGPANLLEAVTVAVSPAARNRGAMIVLNDRIGQATYTSKTNANSLDTFQAIEQGYIGGFLSNKPFFYYPASQPTFKNKFDVTNITELPQVDVLISYQNFDAALIPAAVKAGAKGIVIGGTGAGSTTDVAQPYIEAALAAGIPIVLSSKTNGGAVPPSGSGAISSGFLNPVKSRLQLQLALATGMGMEEIRGLFEDKLAGYLEA